LLGASCIKQGSGWGNTHRAFHNFALDIHHLINSINVLIALVAFTKAIADIYADE
jgi:hypothetical protein